MGTAINLDEIKRFEVTEIYSHPDAKVDIVLVHGLNGDPRRTWTAKENGTFWPTQLLPISLKSAQARILVYGYNADVYTFGTSKSPSSDMIHHHAQSLIANLALERKSEEVEQNPIIFVAHSLGGILVKRALELSNDLTSKNADDNRSIFVSTYGIIFLGTPHNGADPAKWGLILQGMVSALVPKKVMHSESQLVKTLQANNETLQNINLHFLDIYQKFKICMVHEAAPTDLKGTKSFVVDKDSAAPMLPDVLYFGIEATHSGMCKFESKNSPGYMNVSTTIKTWVQECGPIIQARWENEKRQRWQIRQAQAAELLGAFPVSAAVSTSANTPDPSNSMNNSTYIVKSTPSIDLTESETVSQYFIKPSGFRPNSLFEGRQKELTELHEMLFDKKRRAEGTSAVLIQSMPGGGKSHLAREYVYRHRSEYPGGIFWLRAKSITELAAGFWDIARRAVLKNVDETDDDVGEKGKDSDHYIRVVRRWLNHRSGWLMVLDGIHFNETNELRKFIPDSIDTGLIYTSTEKSVSGNHMFMNPQVIKLPLLSEREAQRLLLLELDRREPFSDDDLKHSRELVRAMGFLPVVIHAVAQRLKSTEEPLSRFTRNYVSEPRLRGLGTFMDVVKQLNVLGASETLNLLYILCFFSQHIPVEMISLGLKALDSPYHVPVKASEPISGKSLNNTFKMLNTFALIDRNEQEARGSMQSSQSSKASKNMLSDNVDVIRLHSVVQGFFVDTLFAAGSLPLWLDHAVRLFCCSYDHAHERITSKLNAGLVEDYRLYEIHGIKIHEHILKYLGKHLNDDNKIILSAARLILESRLHAIKDEIERRTPESSHVIAVSGGKPEVFQTSIFDRTSSSSDTGPETPGSSDHHPSKVSTWGLEINNEQYESPTNLLNHEFNRQQLQEIYRQNFPFPLPEDAGYESDRESATGTAMAHQHSHRTVKASSADSNGETVRYSHPTPKKQITQPQHRSVRNMERQRYRDSAGAYRAMTTADPRLTKENALAFFPPATAPREIPRGRVAISGHSSAEISLAQISKNSPPASRGGGMIQDRRSGSGSRPRMMTGLSSYAVAVAGSTKDTILGWRDGASVSRPSTADATMRTSDESVLSAERAGSSAMESLQKFPVDVMKSLSLSPPIKQGPFTAPPNPPYPTTPLAPVRAARYPFPAITQQQQQQGGPSTLNPYPTTIYPRLDGLPPIDLLPSNTIPIPLPQPPISLSHHHSSSSPQSSPPNILSLSFPDIRPSHDPNTTYYPGRPEFSQQSSALTSGGYTSQPMSRDPSGNQSSGAGKKTKPGYAESEPAPVLPMFSPKIPPTSYQVYERLRQLERERDGGGEVMRAEWRRGRSPGLEYARSALIERLEEWKETGGEGGSTTTTPRVPSAPPPNTSIHQSPLPPLFPSPQQPMSQDPSNSTYIRTDPIPFQLQNQDPTSRDATASSNGQIGSGTGEEMVRTSSGGVKIKGRIVEFGEVDAGVGLGIVAGEVDVDGVRERAWRRLVERERERVGGGDAGDGGSH